MRSLLKLFFALALPVLVWTPSSARNPTAEISTADAGSPQRAGRLPRFLENTCPTCQGKPVRRSRKKERRGNCACHQVTYQCEDGSAQTCRDNCE